MKVSITKDKLWLCLPIIVAELMDVTVTLFGQSSEYWKGSYHLVNELNPFARWFMVIHPLGAIIYIVLDITATCVVLLLLPSMFSKVLATFWTIGSAKAIYNWLVGPLQMGWWLSNLAIVIPAIVLVYALEKASVNQTNARQPVTLLEFEFPKKGC